MAIQVFTNATLLMGTGWTGTAPGAPGTQTASGTISTATDEDLSSWLVNATWEVSAEVKEQPTHGSGGFQMRYGGIKSGTLTVEFLQDFGASAIDQLLRTTLGGGDVLNDYLYFDLKPTSSARGTTNPSYVGQILVSEYKPIPVQVGELAITSYSWPSHGLFTTLTS